MKSILGLTILALRLFSARQQKGSIRCKIQSKNLEYFKNYNLKYPFPWADCAETIGITPVDKWLIGRMRVIDLYLWCMAVYCLGQGAGLVNATTMRVNMTFETQLFSPFMGAELFWKTTARVQIESIAFMSRRAQALMELPQTLAHCHSPEDLLTEQVKFWQIAQSQYAQALQKTAGIAPAPNEAASSAVKPVRPRDYILVSDRAVPPAVPKDDSETKAREEAMLLAAPHIRVRRSA